MIEKMKYVCIISSEYRKQEMLEEIRKLGVLHISGKKPAEDKYSKFLETLITHKMLLSEYKSEKSYDNTLSDDDFSKLFESVSSAIEEKNKAESEKTKDSLLYEKMKSWGNFNPEDIDYLSENGIKVFIYSISSKELSELSDSDDVRYIRLSGTGKTQSIAVLDKPLDSAFPANILEIPDVSLNALEGKINKCNGIIENSIRVFKNAAGYLDSYDSQIVRHRDKVNFSSVSETVSNEDGLVWLCGYIPEADISSFTESAGKNGWAYLIDDVADDDENVPTKVRYSKISALMEPVFGILGTVPGYHEYDISFWFLMFFALFFAMIIGDAGYGLIFLFAGIGLHIKQKKTTNLTLLIYVVSLTTVVWGAITGTWFGLEGAMNIPFLRKLVIPPIANYPQYFGVTNVSQQNNVMKFCFMIGTAQLTLACVMNVISKLKTKDLSLVADIGWLLSINALYYVVLLLVINEQANLGLCASVIGCGFLLVCLFGGMAPGKSFGDGLKSGLADTFTNFLDTISAFGNIMSYIRLFAVGLASLAIAQSFNDMALGMTGFMKVMGIAVFAIGHALNLVMGLLSVIVHGVRLNLLEFSGQLNMEWSGTAYEPFKAQSK